MAFNNSSLRLAAGILARMPNMQGDAADAVDGVLRAAINKRAEDVG